MKEVRILNLKIENFKGIRNLEIDAKGYDVNIYGDNATGKTTVCDAFHWLFFNKNSQGRADFAIKPKGIEGPKVAVEAALAVTDYDTIEPEIKTFRKEFVEKWTKKRGFAKPVFTGHTTKYFVDGDRVKKWQFANEVKNFINEIFFEQADPKYFTERLTWKARRKILLELFGSPSLVQEIEEKEKERRRAKDVVDNIDKELKEIPPRIDEAARKLPPEIPEIAPLQEQLAAIEAEKEKVQQQIADIKAGSPEIQKEISALEAEKTEIIKEHTLRVAEAGRKFQEGRSSLEEQQRAAKEALATLEAEAKALERKEKDIEAQIKNLKAKFARAKQSKPDLLTMQEGTCPLCGQDLDLEKIQAINIKRRQEWQMSLKRLADTLNAEGVKLKAELEQVRKEKERLAADTGAARADLEKLNEKIKGLEMPEFLKPEELPAVIKINEKIEALERSITKAAAEKIKELRARLEELKTKEKEVREHISKVEAWQEDIARIEELKEEEKRLVARYDEAERKLSEVEAFIREKCTELQVEINSHFKLAKFRLFIQQINGGIKDTCEVLGPKGVPYPDENTGMKLALGLDIVNTFFIENGEIYPIFLDNRESVTEIPEMPCQIFNLFVSEEDKELRIEVLNQ